MLRARTYESDKAGMNESKKVKRYRSAFTTDQINYLEKQFEKCPYIGSATRKEVANLLGIPEKAIKIWFQNRRMKEKKETNNKEYDIHSHNKWRNNVDFAKDSLNNVHSSQSANDHRWSLQSNVAKNVDTTNCTKYYNDATYSNQSRIDNLKKETIENRKPFRFKGCEMANNTKQGLGRTSLSEPANLMKYNLNQNYNNTNLVNYLELNKKNVSKKKMMPKATPKPGNFRDLMTNMPSTLSRYQDLPEDLSARNLSNAMMPQNHQGNIHLSSAYIPFCNTQDICLSAGNVIWKPVSVVPAMSPNHIPVTVPDRQPTVNQNIVQKCKCNCTCQSKTRMIYDQRTIESQPQYVIAIPYNNNLNILGP